MTLEKMYVKYRHMSAILHFKPEDQYQHHLCVRDQRKPRKKWIEFKQSAAAKREKRKYWFLLFPATHLVQDMQIMLQRRDTRIQESKKFSSFFFI